MIRRPPISTLFPSTTLFRLVSLPKELEEAAVLDAASRWKIFWRVILPLSRPALATLFLLAFLTNWNDFLLPLFVLLDRKSTRLNSSHANISYAVFCLKKKKR